jgi:DNA-binding CsgD family transcriptional regulator
MGIVEELIEARDAYERREWVAAYQALSDVDDAEMQADDFTALATTAYLLGRRNDCVQALQRAFQANLDAGDEAAAARAALRLALVLILGGEPAVGGGWADRAQRILDGIDGDLVERGYALVYETFRHIFAGDFPAAFEGTSEIAAYGQRFDDPDLLAQGLNMRGRLMTHAGQVQEGLRLMDEAMVGVVAGDVSPIIAGIVYCTMIEACLWVSDFGRMAEWTRALTTWCEAQPGLVAFTGQCAVHRGQLMRLRGAYDDALDELERAARRYELLGGDPAVGLAHQERGDVLRLVGDFDGAAQEYDEATRFGSKAQPGRALLWLAKGETAAAATAITTVLGEVGDPIERNRLLPAAVEVLVAAGEIDDASAMTAELGEIAGSFGCPALHAATAAATGRVELARGEAASAAAAVRSAVKQWTTLSAPYEVARCRVLLGQALRLLGDERTAASELTLAHATFAELGAKPAELEVARLLGAGYVPGNLSPRELEVLRLVAAGRTNAQIAAELFVAEKTVARHLSNIFNKLDVDSRTAAAAFAFEHGLT